MTYNNVKVEPLHLRVGTAILLVTRIVGEVHVYEVFSGSSTEGGKSGAGELKVVVQTTVRPWICGDAGIMCSYET